ncbi:hypothetical protein DSO57_1035723 [Entomophthora muscae]|uniref:Uncharacterized protein n=1 Tax=Entomophthora muscae TaxID=34485 RepID=A0ACC2TMK8_9FUNG|nr:hypothetical protein DSO57_1035723 [Entomophthora muscae]
MLEYLGLLAPVVDNVSSALFHLAADFFAVPWPALYSASPKSSVSNFLLQMLFSISVLVATFCYTSKGSKLVSPCTQFGLVLLKQLTICLIYPHCFSLNSASCHLTLTLLATSAVTIPPGSQAILDSQILYELPERTFLELYSPPLLGCNEPYLCLGILDVSPKDPVQFLVANLTALPIHISRGQVIGYVKLLNAPDVISLHPFDMFHDFNLPEDEPQNYPCSLLKTSRNYSWCNKKR